MAIRVPKRTYIKRLRVDLGGFMAEYEDLEFNPTAAYGL